MMNPYTKLIQWVDEGLQVVLITIIEAPETGQMPVGLKWVLKLDGSLLNGSSIPDSLHDVFHLFCQTLTDNVLPCTKKIQFEDGTYEVYGELVSAEPHLFLFGGGHVNRAIAKVAAVAGFLPVIVEDRQMFAKPEEFPAGTRFKVGPWSDVIAQLKFHNNACLVIATRSHAYDTEILLQVVNKKYKYLAMIGSQKKVKGAFAELIKKGIPGGLIKKVHAPMGYDIGGQTPGEIAVSVVAEMIAVRYGKTEIIRSKIN